MSRHEERVDRLRHALRDWGLDAALITDVADVTYLSGFRGDSSYLLVSCDHVWLITDSRYTEQAAMEAPQCEVVQHQAALVKSAAELSVRSRARSVAFEPGAISFATYGELADALDGVELAPRKDLVRTLRAIKDEGEIERIRGAAEAADAAFRSVVERLAPGQTEREVANALEHEMRKRGARKGAFDVIVAARERSSLPHAQATDAVVEPGDAVLIDWGAERDLYCSDCTRVVFTAPPDGRWSAIYGIVREAQQRAIESVRAGVPARDVDAAARGHIAEAGHGEHFGHGLGHGVGLRVHECPAIKAQSEDVLAAGMVVTIEPGIYLPGWGGVRIEDLVVVREGGAEVLSSAAKDLEASILS